MSGKTEPKATRRVAFKKLFNYESSALKDKADSTDTKSFSPRDVLHSPKRGHSTNPKKHRGGTYDEASSHSLSLESTGGEARGVSSSDSPRCEGKRRHSHSSCEDPGLGPSTINLAASSPPLLGPHLLSTVTTTPNSPASMSSTPPLASKQRKRQMSLTGHFPRSPKTREPSADPKDHKDKDTETLEGSDAPVVRPRTNSSGSKRTNIIHRFTPAKRPKTGNTPTITVVLKFKDGSHAEVHSVPLNKTLYELVKEESAARSLALAEKDLCIYSPVGNPLDAHEYLADIGVYEVFCGILPDHWALQSKLLLFKSSKNLPSKLHFIFPNGDTPSIDWKDEMTLREASVSLLAGHNLFFSDCYASDEEDNLLSMDATLLMLRGIQCVQIHLLSADSIHVFLPSGDHLRLPFNPYMTVKKVKAEIEYKTDAPKSNDLYDIHGRKLMFATFAFEIPEKSIGYGTTIETWKRVGKRKPLTKKGSKAKKDLSSLSRGSYGESGSEGGETKERKRGVQLNYFTVHLPGGETRAFTWLPNCTLREILEKAEQQLKSSKHSSEDDTDSTDQETQHPSASSNKFNNSRNAETNATNTSEATNIHYNNHDRSDNGDHNSHYYHTNESTSTKSNTNTANLHIDVCPPNTPVGTTVDLDRTETIQTQTQIQPHTEPWVAIDTRNRILDVNKNIYNIGDKRVAYGITWSSWYLCRAYPHVTEFLSHFANIEARGLDLRPSTKGSPPVVGRTMTNLALTPTGSSTATSTDRILKLYLPEGRIATILLTNPDKPLHGEIRRYIERRNDVTLDKALITLTGQVLENLGDGTLLADIPEKQLCYDTDIIQWIMFNEKVPNPTIQERIEFVENTLPYLVRSVMDQKAKSIEETNTSTNNLDVKGTSKPTSLSHSEEKDGSDRVAEKGDKEKGGKGGRTDRSDRKARERGRGGRSDKGGEEADTDTTTANTPGGGLEESEVGEDVKGDAEAEKEKETVTISTVTSIVTGTEELDDGEDSKKDNTLFLFPKSVREAGRRRPFTRQKTWLHSFQVDDAVSEEGEEDGEVERKKLTRHWYQQHANLSDLDLLEVFLQQEDKYTPNHVIPYRFEKGRRTGSSLAASLSSRNLAQQLPQSLQHAKESSDEHKDSSEVKESSPQSSTQQTLSRSSTQQSPETTENHQSEALEKSEIQRQRTSPQLQRCERLERSERLHPPYTTQTQHLEPLDTTEQERPKQRQPEQLDASEQQHLQDTRQQRWHQRQQPSQEELTLFSSSSEDDFEAWQRGWEAKVKDAQKEFNSTGVTFQEEMG